MMHKRGLILKHILQEGLDLVAVQETIRQDFSDKELKEMGGCNSFIWHWIPARGHSRGLLGAKTDYVELEDVHKADFFIGALIRNRLTNFRFWVLNIYGPAQHEISGDFIQEISGFCSNEGLPIVMGGDFNLVRNNKDRNRGQGDPKLMEIFNDFIGEFQLREIFVSGAKYTWSNKQKEPTLVKLDRILATDTWDLHFCNAYA